MLFKKNDGFGSKIILGILGSKIWVEEIRAQKIIGFKKKCAPTKCWVQQNFESKRILGLKTFLVQKRMGPPKMLAKYHAIHVIKITSMLH